MAMRRNASKYGNKKTTAGGVTFDSKAEAMYYLGLLADKRKGLVKDIELQPRFELLPKFEKNGVKFRAVVYVADFKVTYSDGRTEIVDIKGGKLTKDFVIKRKMFENNYDEFHLLLLKYSPGGFVLHEQY